MYSWFFTESCKELTTSCMISAEALGMTLDANPKNTIGKM